MAPRTTRATAWGRAGIRPAEIDSIVVSHLHGDHFAGLPFLLLEGIYGEARQRPLRIAGPPGIGERVRTLFRAMYGNTADDPLPYALDFVELHPGQSRRLGSLVIDPFLVPHMEREISLGLRLELEGRRILYSGDTGWTEDLVKHSMGTDLFICECYFFETQSPSHLDYARLSDCRHRFGTKRLILTHLGREVLERLDELEIEPARDGMVVAL